jgi:DNA polymerase-3 subunit chi
LIQRRYFYDGAVTEIDFHFNAPNKVHHACRLLRKAVGKHEARLVVVADAGVLDALDAALWDLSPVDFVPHCRADGALHVVARSPVVLMGAEMGTPPPHRQVLVNLGNALPVGFERFDRLIDIVSSDAEDRQLARARWRHYADRGYAIKRHDFGESAA